MSHHTAIHVRHVKGISDEDTGLYQCYIGRDIERHFRLEESDEGIGRTIRHCIMVAEANRETPD